MKSFQFPTSEFSFRFPNFVPHQKRRRKSCAEICLVRGFRHFSKPPARWKKKKMWQQNGKKMLLPCVDDVIEKKRHTYWIIFVFIFAGTSIYCYCNKVVIFSANCANAHANPVEVLKLNRWWLLVALHMISRCISSSSQKLDCSGIGWVSRHYSNVTSTCTSPTSFFEPSWNPNSDGTQQPEKKNRLAI